MYFLIANDFNGGFSSKSIDNLKTIRGIKNRLYNGTIPLNDKVCSVEIRSLNEGIIETLSIEDINNHKYERLLKSKTTKYVGCFMVNDDKIKVYKTHTLTVNLKDDDFKYIMFKVNGKTYLQQFFLEVSANEGIKEYFMYNNERVYISNLI